MLSIVAYLILCLLAVPLALIILLVLFPRPLLSLADKKIAQALDIENYNRNIAYSKPGFLPVHNELSHAEVKVEGTIPADLEGVYIRNGTNTQFENTNSRMHMFNGAGMLHQLQIKDGVATYSNTYVRTPRFKIEDAAGDEIYSQFGDLAGGGKAALFKIIVDLLKKRFKVIPALDNCENSSATTAIQYHHGKLYCLQETGYPFSLQLKNSAGRLHIDGDGEWERFGNQLDTPFTAHPKIDPATGDWYTYSTDIMSGKIHYSIVSEGKLKSHDLLYEAKPALSFLHDYFLTKNFTVFPDLSMRFDSKGLTGEHKSPFYFDADYKMRFGVINRNHKAGEAIRWFVTDLPGHIWHTINGWEETRADGGTDIVLYTPVFRSYPSDVPIHSPREPHAQMHVYRLNLDTGEVTEQRQLMEHFYERPSYNTAYIGQKTQYAYLLDEQGSGGIMGKGVMKYDLLNEKEVKYFDYGDHLGGEALYVAKANASAEDDGYLIDILMSEESSYVVIIDAASMEELAKLHLPQRVPYGVHGCWLNQQQLDNLQLS
ncbi:carotenoid oxygenase family protein [Oceanicoccus sp. KOV_DT_Chl]|uniref:carotenoid oxygenase family protein n=1 Tax=Oceanicoccus sp. KOV_DT_Chl TaxID=1904639 RepID=UPI00190EAEE3|nr:carotenoid oxygenase family protein [Oceanicoccus sp. KOV_DT_Chl]